MSPTAALLLSLMAGGTAPDRESGWDQVARLWPKAKVRTVRRLGRTQRIIAPVERRGESGFIDRVDRHVAKELGVILAFSIQVAKTPDLEAWIAGRSSPKEVRHLAQVLFLPEEPVAKGKIIKPAGFPLERVIDTTCMGDVCGHVPLYQGLMAVEGFLGMVVLLVSPAGYDVQVGHVLQTDIDTIRVRSKVQGPSRLADVTGCDGKTEWRGLYWDKKNAKLKVSLTKTCPCGEDCADFGYEPGVIKTDGLARPVEERQQAADRVSGPAP